MVWVSHRLLSCLAWWTFCLLYELATTVRHPINTPFPSIYNTYKIMQLWRLFVIHLTYLLTLVCLLSRSHSFPLSHTCTHTIRTNTYTHIYTVSPLLPTTGAAGSCMFFMCFGLSAVSISVSVTASEMVGVGNFFLILSLIAMVTLLWSSVTCCYRVFFSWTQYISIKECLLTEPINITYQDTLVVLFTIKPFLNALYPPIHPPTGTLIELGLFIRGALTTWCFSP